MCTLREHLFLCGCLGSEELFPEDARNCVHAAIQNLWTDDGKLHYCRKLIFEQIRSYRAICSQRFRREGRTEEWCRYEAVTYKGYICDQCNSAVVARDLVCDKCGHVNCDKCRLPSADEVAVPKAW